MRFMIAVLVLGALLCSAVAQETQLALSGRGAMLTSTAAPTRALLVKKKSASVSSELTCTGWFNCKKSVDISITGRKLLGISKTASISFGTKKSASVEVSKGASHGKSFGWNWSSLFTFSKSGR